MVLGIPEMVGRTMTHTTRGECIVELVVSEEQLLS